MFRFHAPERVPRAKAPTSKLASLPIPYKGLNARSPFSVMPPEYGVALNNVLVETFGLRTRRGWREWATNIPGGTVPVGTVMHYYPAGAVPAPSTTYPVPTLPTVVGQLFAAKDSAVYDVTAGGGGPWVAEAGIAGVTDLWTTVNLQNIAGSFLLAVNDGGGYAYYNGSTWTTPISGTAPGDIDGVNPSDFCNICTYKKRVWFVEKGTTRAWYLGVDQITGVATSFDFGSQFDHGGELVALVNWTIDSGKGMDDQLVAVSSQGDVVIYTGIDPDTASTFNIVGTYYVGPLPAGYRQCVSMGGDVLILSQYGLQQVSKLIQATSLSAQVLQQDTYVIDPLIASIMREVSAYNGWQIMDCAKEELLVVGIPQEATDYGDAMFGFKTTTKAWSVLWSTGYEHLLNVGGTVWGGTHDGDVCIAFYGPLDGVTLDSTGGTGIQCRVTPSYSVLENPSIQKRFVLVRPCFLATVTPDVSITILTDYSLPQDINVPTYPTSVGAKWDISDWDEGLWAGIRPTIREWIGIKGVGFAVTPQIDYMSGGDTLLTSIDMLWEPGGIL